MCTHTETKHNHNGMEKQKLTMNMFGSLKNKCAPNMSMKIRGKQSGNGMKPNNLGVCEQITVMVLLIMDIGEGM